MKRLFRTSLFFAVFVSVNGFAATKIIIKDIEHHTSRVEQQLPPVLQRAMHRIRAHQQSLYEIVVHQFADHYTVYLLSNRVWGLKRYYLDLNGNFIANPGHDFDGNEEDGNAICPDPNVQFLAISAYPEVGGVNEAIKIVSDAAQKKYKTTTILDGNADGIVYKNWFACTNLKAIYSIGHGSNDGIMVGNGDFIDYSYFANEKFNNNFKDTTVFINSCQVFNYPFGSEFVYGNAMLESEFNKNPGPHVRQYLGGETNLLMVSSELSSACLMVKAIDGETISYKNLQACVGDRDLHYQDFGIAYPGRGL